MLLYSTLVVRTNAAASSLGKAGMSVVNWASPDAWKNNNISTSQWCVHILATLQLVCWLAVPLVILNCQGWTVGSQWTLVVTARKMQTLQQGCSGLQYSSNRTVCKYLCYCSLVLKATLYQTGGSVILVRGLLFKSTDLIQKTQNNTFLVFISRCSI